MVISDWIFKIMVDFFSLVGWYRNAEFSIKIRIKSDVMQNDYKKVLWGICSNYYLINDFVKNTRIWQIQTVFLLIHLMVIWKHIFNLKIFANSHL